MPPTSGVPHDFHGRRRRRRVAAAGAAATGQGRPRPFSQGTSALSAPDGSGSSSTSGGDFPAAVSSAASAVAREAPWDGRAPGRGARGEPAGGDDGGAAEGGGGGVAVAPGGAGGAEARGEGGGAAQRDRAAAPDRSETDALSVSSICLTTPCGLAGCVCSGNGDRESATESRLRLHARRESDPLDQVTEWLGAACSDGLQRLSAWVGKYDAILITLTQCTGADDNYRCDSSWKICSSSRLNEHRCDGYRALLMQCYVMDKLVAAVRAGRGFSVDQEKFEKKLFFYVFSAVDKVRKEIGCCGSCSACPCSVLSDVVKCKLDRLSQLAEAAQKHMLSPSTSTDGILNKMFELLEEIWQFSHGLLGGDPPVTGTAVSVEEVKSQYVQHEGRMRAVKLVERANPQLVALAPRDWRDGDGLKGSAAPEGERSWISVPGGIAMEKSQLSSGVGDTKSGKEKHLGHPRQALEFSSRIRDGASPERRSDDKRHRSPSRSRRRTPRLATSVEVEGSGSSLAEDTSTTALGVEESKSNDPSSGQPSTSGTLGARASPWTGAAADGADDCHAVARGAREDSAQVAAQLQRVAQLERRVEAQQREIEAQQHEIEAQQREIAAVASLMPARAKDNR